MNKKRTALTWYKLGRMCTSCDAMIVDVNKSGYCASCYRRYQATHKSNARETLAHKKLKVRARLFLGDMGCANIQEEYTIGTSLNGKGSIRVDVVGFRDSQLVAVECGGSTDKKLNKACGYIRELWVLPYGESMPFKWSIGKSVCHTCGHVV